MQQPRRAPTATAALAGLVLLAGCGNWSNEDLVFLAALPDRTELAAEMPGAAATSAALASPDVREQALLGAVSDGHRFTREASLGFNGFLFDVLASLEHVRGLPPSERALDARTWGPWPDPEHPGWHVRLRMQRTDCRAGTVRRCGRYAYALEMAPGRDGAFTAVLVGTYDVAGTISEGQGALQLHLDRMRDLGLEVDAFPAVDRIDVLYRTAPAPLVVWMRFVGGLEADGFTYGYVETGAGGGAASFRMRADVVAGPLLEDLVIWSAWRPDGVGLTVMTVSGGNLPLEAEKTECWDAAGRLTFSYQAWDGLTEGDVDACPDDGAEVPEL